MHAAAMKPRLVRTTRGADIIYLIKGQDSGKDAWYYLKVNKLKLPLLENQVTNSSEDKLDLPSYGTVLDYGWGSEPPKSIQEEIEVKYG